MLDFDWDKFCWFNLSIGTLQGFALGIFAYVAHTTIFMIKKELIQPTKEKCHTIIYRSVVTETVLYVISSYAGYLSALTKTPPIIINR
jgi:amino acid permease